MVRTANWEALRSRLMGVKDQLSLSWAELDDLVGGLPRSAHAYPAYWAGDRSQWHGFRATDVRLGDHVTFVRHGRGATTATPTPTPTSNGSRNRQSGKSDLVLIGCVKSK